ncbi:MAG: GIY-YIG nuclease family protein [Patescibacteria group bacterium]
MRSYFVYILSSSCNSVLYIGVTGNLERRIAQHRQKTISGFSSRYNLKKLVLLEETTDIRSALERENQLKNWSRTKKRRLIEMTNPYWIDLLPEQQTDPSTPLSLRSG